MPASNPARTASRKQISLCSNLEDRLRSYAACAMANTHGWDRTTLAASVLGFSGMALVSPMPAEAEVIFTPANEIIQRKFGAGVSFFNLDVNHDGQVDFVLSAWRGSDFSSGNFELYLGMGAFGEMASNEVMSTNQKFWAAALPWRARIGPEGRFTHGLGMAQCSTFFRRHFQSGPWKGKTSQYLGLKFVINGETHFGWARLTAACGGGFLTGYAYETEPNRPLAAGVLPFQNESKSSPVLPPATVPKRASLGALAMGAAGLPVWRSAAAH